MKNIYLITIFIFVNLSANLFFAPSLFSQDNEDGEDEQEETQILHKPLYNKENELIAFSLEVIPSPTGGSFFDEYARLGSKLTTLNDSWLPTATMYFDQTENFKISGRVSYNNFNLTDLYLQKARNPDKPLEKDTGAVAAAILESIATTQVPILLGVHYLPVRSHYTSYVGVQVGASISSVKWQTTTRSISNSLLLNRPAINTSSVLISPAARIYTGFELRFDELISKDNPFRGIMLEVAYFYLPIKNNFFERIINESKGAYLLPENPSASLQCGGITISLGATLQFSKK